MPLCAWDGRLKGGGCQSPLVLLERGLLWAEDLTAASSLPAQGALQDVRMFGPMPS